LTGQARKGGVAVNFLIKRRNASGEGFRKKKKKKMGKRAVYKKKDGTAPKKGKVWNPGGMKRLEYVIRSL